MLALPAVGGPKKETESSSESAQERVAETRAALARIHIPLEEVELAGEDDQELPAKGGLGEEGRIVYVVKKLRLFVVAPGGDQLIPVPAGAYPVAGSEGRVVLVGEEGRLLTDPETPDTEPPGTLFLRKRPSRLLRKRPSRL